jgi:DNA-binding response OmpR family regulator
MDAVFQKALPGYNIVNLTDSGNLDFETAINENRPQLIIIDSVHGLKRNCEICRRLRPKTTLALVVATSYRDESDEITALEAGADGYVSRTADLRLLRAQLAVFGRRAQLPPIAERPPTTGDYLSLEELTVNTVNATAQISDRELQLTTMEYSILHLFIKNIGRTFSRQQIIDSVCGDNFDGFDRTIDSHVKNLRKKINDAAPGQSYIKTIYGLGYKIAAPTKICQ